MNTRHLRAAALAQCSIFIYLTIGCSAHPRAGTSSITLAGHAADPSSEVLGALRSHGASIEFDDETGWAVVYDTPGTRRAIHLSLLKFENEAQVALDDLVMGRTSDPQTAGLELTVAVIMLAREKVDQLRQIASKFTPQFVYLPPDGVQAGDNRFDATIERLEWRRVRSNKGERTQP